jgi:hypothetical protein
MRRWPIPQLIAIALASLAAFCVLLAAGFAIGDDRTGAAVSLIVAGVACLSGATLALLGWQGKALRQIAGTLGVLANLGIGLVVIIFAVSFRW